MTGIAEWLASIGLGEYADDPRKRGRPLGRSRSHGAGSKGPGRPLGIAADAARIVELRDRFRGHLEQTPSRRRGTTPASSTTVMFWDLVGSSALWPALIWRTLPTVMGAYDGRDAKVVAEIKGIIVRYMGEGVLAYFGYPEANEDYAEQATRAGLALVDAVAKLRTDPPPSYRSRRHRYRYGGRGRFDREGRLKSRRSLARRRTWLRAYRRSPIPVPC